MRVIARLDVKNGHVIKGIHLEGLRKVGDPTDLAQKYYLEDIDEIFFMDAVASLYDRNGLFDIISKSCERVFVPITVGGGIRSLDDVEKALAAGADKVAVNSAAVRNIGLISEIAKRYGSQCIVGSIDAMRRDGAWEAYIDNGREPTDLNVVDWVKRLEDSGAGEIMLTSVDFEGTFRGYDLDLVFAVQDATSSPVVVSGGFGKIEHLNKIFGLSQPSGLVIAGALHYNKVSIACIKDAVLNNLA